MLLLYTWEAIPHFLAFLFKFNGRNFPHCFIFYVLVGQCFHFFKLALVLPIFGPRLKTEGSYKIASVCAFVRAFFPDYLGNRSNNFSEILHEVGHI